MDAVKMNGRTVYMMEVSLRNEAKAREWFDRLKTYTQLTNAQVFIEALQRLFRSDSDVMHYINEYGGLNEVTVERMAEEAVEAHRSDYEFRTKEAQENGEDYLAEYVPLPMDVALKDARERLKQGWKQYQRDNPEAMKSVLFDLQGWPVTYNAMHEGIKCVKATVCRERTDRETLGYIDSETTGEWWHGVTALEVAQYVDSFRSLSL